MSLFGRPSWLPLPASTVSGHTTAPLVHALGPARQDLCTVLARQPPVGPPSRRRVPYQGRQATKVDAAPARRGPRPHRTHPAMAEYMRYDSETGDVYPKADFKLPRGSLFQSEMALPGHESSIKSMTVNPKLWKNI